MEVFAFAHSDNVDDNGEKIGGYDNYLSADDTKNIVTIENAQKLKVTLKYIGENKPFFADDADKNAKAMIAANADRKGEIDMLDVIKILQIAKENKNA